MSPGKRLTAAALLGWLWHINTTAALRSSHTWLAPSLISQFELFSCCLKASTTVRGGHPISSVLCREDVLDITKQFSWGPSHRPLACFLHLCSCSLVQYLSPFLLQQSGFDLFWNFKNNNYKVNWTDMFQLKVQRTTREFCEKHLNYPRELSMNTRGLPSSSIWPWIADSSLRAPNTTSCLPSI